MQYERYDLISYSFKKSFSRVKGGGAMETPSHGNASKRRVIKRSTPVKGGGGGLKFEKGTGDYLFISRGLYAYN